MKFVHYELDLDPKKLFVGLNVSETQDIVCFGIRIQTSYELCIIPSLVLRIVVTNYI